jgi:hypothetical protein
VRGGSWRGLGEEAGDVGLVGSLELNWRLEIRTGLVRAPMERNEREVFLSKAGGDSRPTGLSHCRPAKRRENKHFSFEIMCCRSASLSFHST